MKISKKDKKQGAFWHPDFRNPAALPDVKVVRTSFFLNVCAVVVLCAVLILFFYREYESKGVSERIGFWEGQVAERKPRNKQAVELHHEFTAEAGKIRELETFRDVPIVVSEFLAALARSLPDRIILSRVQYRRESGSPEIVLSGRVLGISDDATDVVSAYEASFSDDPYFSGVVGDVNVSSVNRNPDSGTLSFNFILLLDGNPAKQG